MLTIGEVVRISTLSKESYYLYKSYIQHSPLLICPCRCKKDIPMTIIDIFEKNIVLLKINNSKKLTMTYGYDLEPIYEREKNDEKEI